ncbi:MAG: hypothetical protein GF344_05615, partial [Chitinivibrionales bacterium]|nr:hypothetical protein [Chitinivibrionales bacterium]
MKPILAILAFIITVNAANHNVVRQEIRRLEVIHYLNETFVWGKVNEKGLKREEFSKLYNDAERLLDEESIIPAAWAKITEALD